MAETPRRRPSSYEISNTPLVEDWSALIIAIDHVLALDNEEWTKRLAVLTAEALYLLEPETGDPDPLSPFSHTWWRIGMHDLTDIQFVPAEGELRLCTSLLFESDAHLRHAPGSSVMRDWHDVIRMVWTERSETVLQRSIESCLPGIDRPSSPGPGSSSSRTRRPWRREALPEIDAIGTLLKERDGLLWGGLTERTFVLLSTGTFLYYLRTPDSNGELLGDLRGVIELDGATLELQPLEEEEHAAIPGSSSSSLLLTAAVEPEPQPFYEVPKRCGSLSVRCETAQQQRVLEERLRKTIAQLRRKRGRPTPSGVGLRQRTPPQDDLQPGVGATPTSTPRRLPLHEVVEGETPTGVGTGLGTGVGTPPPPPPAVPPLTLLLLLNLSWLLVRLAPGGSSLWAALLVANAGAVYVLRLQPRAVPPLGVGHSPRHSQDRCRSGRQARGGLLTHWLPGTCAGSRLE